MATMGDYDGVERRNHARKVMNSNGLTKRPQLESSNRSTKKIAPLFSADDFLKEAHEIEFDCMMDGYCELTEEGCNKLSEMLRYAYAFIQANS